MKTLKTVLVTFVLLISMSFNAHAQDKKGKDVTLDFPNYQKNIALLKNYVAALNAGDANKLSSYVADDAMIIGLSNSKDTISKKEHLERYTGSFKDNNYTITKEIYLAVKAKPSMDEAEGEYGFSWGSVANMNKATKKTAETRYHVVAHIVDNKIHKMWHYYDTMPFVLRDGYTITPPKKM